MASASSHPVLHQGQREPKSRSGWEKPLELNQESDEKVGLFNVVQPRTASKKVSTTSQNSSWETGGRSRTSLCVSKERQLDCGTVRTAEMGDNNAAERPELKIEKEDGTDEENAESGRQARDKKEEEKKDGGEKENQPQKSYAKEEKEDYAEENDESLVAADVKSAEVDDGGAGEPAADAAEDHQRSAPDSIGENCGYSASSQSPTSGVLVDGPRTHAHEEDRLEGGNTCRAAEHAVAPTPDKNAFAPDSVDAHKETFAGVRKEDSEEISAVASTNTDTKNTFGGRRGAVERCPPAKEAADNKANSRNTTLSRGRRERIGSAGGDFERESLLPSSLKKEEFEANGGNPEASSFPAAAAGKQALIYASSEGDEPQNGLDFQPTTNVYKEEPPLERRKYHGLQRECKERRELGFALSAEADVCSKGDYEKSMGTGIDAAARASSVENRGLAGVDSDVNGTDEAQVVEVQFGSVVDTEQKPTSSAEWENKFEGEEKLSKSPMKTWSGDAHQSTSVSSEEESNQSLVTHRRQQFEQRAPPRASHHGCAQLMPPLVIRRDPRTHPSNEEAGEETRKAVAAAGAGEDRCAQDFTRRGSVVDKLRERYERSSTGSRAGSLNRQLPANYGANTVAPTRAGGSQPEPRWRRRQEVKLAVAQRAAAGVGVCAVGVVDAAGRKNREEGSTRDAAADGVIKRWNSAGSAGQNADVKNRSRATATSDSSASGLEQVAAQRRRESIITIHAGERSTVTFLKEKFERRRAHLDEERGRRPDVQQLQRRTQQERQQTQQQYVKAVKSLKSHWERRRKSVEDTNFSSSCRSEVSANDKSPSAAMEMPGTSEQEGGVCSQQGDSDTASTAVILPVKVVKEHYERRLVSGASPSPRAAPCIPVGTSTSVKTTRELLSSVDVVGRYGQVYRVSKTALEKTSNHLVADELSADKAPDKQGGRRAAAAAAAAIAPAGRVETHGSVGNDSPCQICELVNGESAKRSASAEGDGKGTTERKGSEDSKTLKQRGARTDGSNAAAGKGAGAYASQVAVRDEVERVPHRERKEAHMKQTPAVNAHVSAKIGALASALGPAFINFGKAPPPRLLTRVASSEKTEEPDVKAFGFSKAQAAIARRKREIALLADTTNGEREEQVRDENGTAAAHCNSSSGSDRSGGGRNTDDVEERGDKAKIITREVNNAFTIAEEERSRRDSGEGEESISCGVKEPERGSERKSTEACDAGECSREKTTSSCRGEGQIFTASSAEGQDPTSSNAQVQSIHLTSKDTPARSSIGVRKASIYIGGENHTQGSSSHVAEGKIIGKSYDAEDGKYTCEGEQGGLVRRCSEDDIPDNTEAQGGAHDRQAQAQDGGTHVDFDGSNCYSAEVSISDNSRMTLLSVARGGTDERRAVGVEGEREGECCQAPLTGERANTDRVIHAAEGDTQIPAGGQESNSASAKAGVAGEEGWTIEAAKGGSAIGAEGLDFAPAEPRATSERYPGKEAETEAPDTSQPSGVAVHSFSSVLMSEEGKECEEVRTRSGEGEVEVERGTEEGLQFDDVPASAVEDTRKSGQNPRDAAVFGSGEKREFSFDEREGSPEATCVLADEGMEIL